MTGSPFQVPRITLRQYRRFPASEQREAAVPRSQSIADDGQRVRRGERRDVAHALLPDEVRDDADDHHEDEEQDEEHHSVRAVAAARPSRRSVAHELTQHERQDSAVAQVLHVGLAVEPADGVELDVGLIRRDAR